MNKFRIIKIVAALAVIALLVVVWIIIAGGAP